MQWIVKNWVIVVYEQNKPLMVQSVYSNSVSVFEFQFSQYNEDQDSEVFSLPRHYQMTQHYGSHVLNNMQTWY